MTSPNTHPAERKTPAGEAMREAVARQIRAWANRFGALRSWSSLADTLLKSGPIASELARLTERAVSAEARTVRLQREATEADRGKAGAVGLWQGCTVIIKQLEAALTTLRADHAAEAARKDADIARLTFALAASLKYQKALDHCLERCSLPCIACQRLEGIRESAFIRRAALATAVARARREALEEAAGIADARAPEWDPLPAAAVIDTASAIRALAAAPPEARQTEANP